LGIFIRAGSKGEHKLLHNEGSASDVRSRELHSLRSEEGRLGWGGARQSEQSPAPYHTSWALGGPFRNDRAVRWSAYMSRHRICTATFSLTGQEPIASAQFFWRKVKRRGPQFEAKAKRAIGPWFPALQTTKEFAPVVGIQQRENPATPSRCRDRRIEPRSHNRDGDRRQLGWL